MPIPHPVPYRRDERKQGTRVTFHINERGSPSIRPTCCSVEEEEGEGEEEEEEEGEGDDIVREREKREREKRERERDSTL